MIEKFEMPEKKNETTVWKIQRCVLQERVFLALLRTPSHCDVDAAMAKAMQKRKQFKVHMDFDASQEAWRNNKIIKYSKNVQGQTVMTGFQYKPEKGNKKDKSMESLPH